MTIRKTSLEYMASAILATFLVASMFAPTITIPIAFAFPDPPVIDGVFTGWPPVNEYANAAVDPGAGLYCWYYQLNDGTVLYTINDFYVDTTNDIGGATLDYNIFLYDLDNDGTFEWQLNVYADGVVVVLLNDIVIPPGQYPTYGIQAATGFGTSPKQPTTPHRMYEISIKHAGIGKKIYTDPNDPPAPVPPPPDRKKPPLDGLVEAWKGYVTPQEDGHPIVKYGPWGVVGGIVVPVDKLALLAPYFGLTSTILFATAATAIYVKRVKRRKEKQ